MPHTVLSTSAILQRSKSGNVFSKPSRHLASAKEARNSEGENL